MDLPVYVLVLVRLGVILILAVIAYIFLTRKANKKNTVFLTASAPEEIFGTKDGDVE